MDDLWRPQDHDDELRSNGIFGLDRYQHACQAAEARLQSPKHSSPREEAVSPFSEKREAPQAKIFEFFDQAGVPDDFLTSSSRAQGPLNNTPEFEPTSR